MKVICFLMKLLCDCRPAGFCCFLEGIVSYVKRIHRFIKKHYFRIWTVFQANDVCGQLQLLFALLQEGCHQCLDPSPFVSALGLDTGLQQVIHLIIPSLLLKY